MKEQNEYYHGRKVVIKVEFMCGSGKTRRVYPMNSTGRVINTPEKVQDSDDELIWVQMDDPAGAVYVLKTIHIHPSFVLPLGSDVPDIQESVPAFA